MNCPSADKLSQYVDELLEKEEHQAVKMHIIHCEKCQHILQIYEGETQFIKETLATPSLPNDFDEKVLAQIQPYKKKRAFYKISPVSATVAAALLSFGLLIAVTPSLADFVTSLFSSEQVDSGINEAYNNGFVEAVNLTTTDQNMTIHIDEVMVDTKRIAIAFRATNSKGQEITPTIGQWDRPLNLQFKTNGGTLLDDVMVGTSFKIEGKTGYLEIEAPNFEHDVTLHWQIGEVNDKKGDWQLAIPIPIKKALAYLNAVPIEQTVMQNELQATFERVEFTPSSTTLYYSTDMTKPFPNDYRISMTPMVRVAYTIENEQHSILAVNRVYGEYFAEDSNALSSSGGGGGDTNMWDWEEMFSTIQEPKPYLNIVGFEKPIYINEQVTFNPSKLEQPAVIKYGGKSLQITEVQRVKTNNHEPRFEITLQYDEESLPQLDKLYLVDDAGTDYFISGFNGNKLVILKEMNLGKTYTLTLLTGYVFEELETPVRIPLFE